MVKFSSLVTTIRSLVKKVENEKGENINYNFDDIKFDNKLLNHKENPDVKQSERVVFKCPQCDVYTTAGYDTLKSTRTGGLYCITENCSYFLKNKKLGLFDVKRLFSERNQSLVSKNYINSKQRLEVCCNECLNIRNVSFLEFYNGNACSKSDCKFNRIRIDKYSGNIYRKENRMNEKIHYEYEFKINGFKLLNVVKNEEDEAYLQCVNGHVFYSKFIKLKKTLNNSKDRLFCNECEKEKEWIDILKYMNDAKLSISTRFSDFESMTKTKITFSCKRLHSYSYTKKEIQERLDEQNNFSCHKCLREEEMMRIKDKIYTENLIPLNNSIIDNSLSKYRTGDKILIPKDDFAILKTDDSIVDKIMSLISDIDILLPQYKISLTDLINDRTTINEDRNGFFIVPNNNGRKIANHHMQRIMITSKKDCNKMTYIDAWNDLDIRRQLIERAVKYDLMFNNGTLYGCYGCKYGKVYNFPPNVARCIYNSFNAKRVLDFCSGYGGRLVGFWFSNAEKYVGIDPHTKLPYKELINSLGESKIGRDERDVTMICECAEEVDYSRLGIFDLIFTSPPYFSTEIYSDEKTQSCVRYPDFEDWINSFLFTTLKKVSSVLSSGGHLIVNIKDHKKYKIIERMIDYATRLLNLHLTQIIELRHAKRHKNTKGEYIYVFKKRSVDIEIVFED